MPKHKTVYILGAGASVSAKLPTQAKTLSFVFSISRLSFDKMEPFSDFLSLKINYREQRIQEFYGKFDEYRKELGEFIVSNFSTSDKLTQYTAALDQAKSIRDTSVDAQEEKEKFINKAYEIVKTVNVTLEDLFTIFDSVNAGREHFRLYSPSRMIEIQNHLRMCIIYALSYSIATSCDDSDYTLFSEKLLKKRIASSLKDDTFSIITTNWDDVFERSLYRLCNQYNSTKQKNQQRVCPDLCFYNYDINQKDDHIPSIQVKAKGLKNIKVLKMHGSLAWLECPKCKRIFTDFADEIASEEFANTTCPFCQDAVKTNGDSPVLRSLILTPTFMKSLDNLNIKNIWHNAYIDISEADQIVFIGYSFPDADFEMRCLLKKATKNNVKVDVVLCPSDDPSKLIYDLMNRGFSAEEAKEYVWKMNLPQERYISFFGEDRVGFFYGGFSKYINSIDSEE